MEASRLRVALFPTPDSPYLSAPQAGFFRRLAGAGGRRAPPAARRGRRRAAGPGRGRRLLHLAQHLASAPPAHLSSVDSVTVHRTRRPLIVTKAAPLPAFKV